MAASIGILACSVVADEFRAVIKARKWDDVQVIPLEPACLPGPSGLDSRPPPALSEADPGLDLHLIGCTCRTLPPGGGEPSLNHHPLSDCFHAVLPGPLVDHYTADGGHLVTPGWLTAWRDHLARLGLDARTARQMFQETARRVVLLDTGLRRDAVTDAGDFARHVGLPLQVVPVGLDQVTLLLRGIVMQSRLERQIRTGERLESQLQTARAQSHMLLDMQSELSGLRDEMEILERIHYIFSMLFSPGKLIIASFRNHAVALSWPVEPSERDLAGLQEFLTADPIQNHRLTDYGTGFFLSFGRRDAPLGGALVADLALPEHLEEYLNLALALAPVCKLVLYRARSLQGIIPVCSFCHQIRDKQNRWSRFESYISSRSEALFSHTVCPVCKKEHYPELDSDPE